MSKEKLKYNPAELDSLSNFAPELSKINKENPFRVPKDYFNELPIAIQSKVSKSKQISVWERFIQLFKQPKYSISFATVAATFIVALALFINPDVQEEDFISGITVEDIINEYPEFISSIDESMIIELLFVDNNYDIEDYFNTNIESDSSISEDDIIDYLSDENFDTELIYNL